MADQKNDPKAANAAQDDKSINDLLKEYAEDVKDKDLDDFLKGTDDDSFDTDSGDDDGDNDDTGVDSMDPPKKSGGFFTALMLVVAFGAAGAGAYIYLNRNEGMTAIMGGFMGGDNANQTAASTLAPETQPVMPAPANDMGTPAQPAPISNEATSGAPGSAYSTMEDPTTGNQPILAGQPATPDTAAPTAPAADASLPAPETTPAQPVPTPVAATPNTAELSPAMAQASEAASKAVDAWAASVGNNGAPATSTANTGQKLPEQAVAEVKAKAPTTAKKEKAKAAKVVEKAADTSADTSEAAPAAAPKAKAPLSPLDEALPPPYMAIQARKAGGATPDATAFAAAAPVPATSAPKMQPVVEGGASASVSANDNVSDVSKTTGDLATMVGQGGGKIEIVNHAVAPTAAPAALAAQAPAPAPVSQPVVPAPRVVTQQASVPAPTPNTAIGIGGSGSGRSVPPSDDDGAAPAKAAANQTPAQSLPESTDSAPQEQGLQAPVQPSAPVAAPVGAQDAKALLAQAMSLENAGKGSEALSLYQRALEADAVYADGKSIDRGMVYDRIGALRAAGTK